MTKYATDLEEKVLFTIEHKGHKYLFKKIINSAGDPYFIICDSLDPNDEMWRCAPQKLPKILEDFSELFGEE